MFVTTFTTSNFCENVNFGNVHGAALCLMLVIAAGCAGPGPLRPISAAGDPISVAQDAAAAGEHLAAAEAYLEATSRYPDRQLDLGLKAAESFILGQRGNQAQLLLDELAQQEMSLEQSLSLNLLRAQLQVDRGAPRTALKILPVEPAGWMSEEQQRRMLSLRALAYSDIGDPYASATQRLRLAPLLSEQIDWKENRRQILTTLRQLSAEELERYQSHHDTSDPMMAWLALASALKRHLAAGGSPSPVLQQWESDYPGIVTAEDEDWLGEYVGGFRPPERIALLLPLSGRLASAGRAIRDGFFAGYYEDTNALPSVLVYDTASTVYDAIAAYAQAQADGADQIVGPLSKPAIGALVGQHDELIPMLALNQFDATAVGEFAPFQFGLLPEDEARAVAEHMLERGLQRVITMIPDNDWGTRVGRAFIEHFEQLGGWVISTTVYAPSANDHGLQLKETLGLNDAMTRQRDLARLLGRPMEFEPNRRADVDAVFLAARPGQARSIKPQLRFHRAGDLPVFATSHVFDGVLRPEQDRDLDGLIFCDSPWLLQNSPLTPSRASVASIMDSAAGSRARLFALGMDAYRLLPYLEWLSRFSNEAIPGATGDLSINADNSVSRKLDFARFRGGRPRPLIPQESSTGPRAGGTR